MKVIPLIRQIVQILFFALLIILTVFGLERIWLPLLICGIVTSPFWGHWYCGWICPVNTTAKLFKVENANQNATRLHLFQIMWFGTLAAIIIICLIMGIRIKLFVGLTLIGIVLSLLVPKTLWCRNLCPWMAIIQLTQRLPFVVNHTNHLPCHACKTCFASCAKKGKRQIQTITSPAKPRPST